MAEEWTAALDKRPIIAIPLGDPAGIGPEIVIKALADSNINKAARCVVIGDYNVLCNAMRFKNMPTLNINKINLPETGDYSDGTLNVIDLANVDILKLKVGKISGMCGRAAYEYIKKSIELAMAKKADAVATTPINKEALKACGIAHIGHTEIFAALTKTPDPLTMFQVRNLRVFFLTRHVSLRQACDMVTRERIIDYVKRCMAALDSLGIRSGRMAIAGLNPHSGEHGLFGDEEVKHVYPAVEELKALGYNVDGPVGADSVFHLALQGRYDCVLSLYHDQGHIATKTLDFEKTISITAGMPILRTSVDHGTAMDIAGCGIASSVSMTEAIKIACSYAPYFKA